MNTLILKHSMAQLLLEKNKKYRRAKGYVSLLSMLIATVIGLGIATSLLLLGINSAKGSITLIQSNQAKGLANACLEHALLSLNNSSAYAGNETINFPLGSCQVAVVVNGGGQVRTIQTTGTVGTVVRKVQAQTSQLTPTVVITSWQEIP